MLPAGLRGHPKDVFGGVLVATLQEALRFRAGNALGREFLSKLWAASVKCVGDVLQENQSEDDVLVLGGVD